MLSSRWQMAGAPIEDEAPEGHDGEPFRSAGRCRAGELGAREGGPVLAVLAVVAGDPAEQPPILPTRDGAFPRARFRRALGLDPM
jgi:hypothetical protein